jgi:hypothetical protein
MMKNSSNIDMEEVFEHLANIKKAEPSTNLHTRILNSIHKQNVIPLFWVRAVASLLIAFITTELYIASNKNNANSENISIMISKTNNILYHE